MGQAANAGLLSQLFLLDVSLVVFDLGPLALVQDSSSAVVRAAESVCHG